MGKTLEEKIEVVERIAEESAAKFENVKQAVENAMQAADEDEEGVELAEQLFEFAAELPSEVAVPLGRSIFQQVNDQIYYEIMESGEFKKYAEEYREHIPPRVLREQDIPVKGA